MVSGRSFGSSAVSLACITSMCSVQCFRGGHSLRLAFGSFFYPHPSPLNSSTVNQCDGCLVPLAWGLMAGGRGFASHGGVTLSRGWPCHRWKPLDIPGTHLHAATQLLMVFLQTKMADFFTLSCTSAIEIPTLKPEKGTPFGRSLSE